MALAAAAWGPLGGRPGHAWRGPLLLSGLLWLLVAPTALRAGGDAGAGSFCYVNRFGVEKCEGGETGGGNGCTCGDDAECTTLGCGESGGGGGEWNSPLTVAPRGRGGEVTFDVTPGVYRNLPTSFGDAPADPDVIYNSEMDLLITGLVPGETVLVERYLLTSDSGQIDAESRLMASYRITDNARPTFNGVANANVPGDEESLDGLIVAQLNHYERDQTLVAGTHALRLSSPTGSFAPQVDLVEVEGPGVYEQAYTGTVRTAGGDPVPGAIVTVLQNISGRYAYRYATVAGADGSYTLPAPAGDHWVVGIAPGYTARVTAETRTPLASGAETAFDPVLEAADRLVSGRIVDAAAPDRGLGGVRLMLANEAGDFTLAMSAADGTWTAAVRDGTWRMELHPESVMAQGYLAPPVIPAVEVAGSDRADLDLALTAGTALVTGSVAIDGEALGNIGIRVMVEHGETGERSFGVTDVEGRFAVAGRPGYSKLTIDYESIADRALGTYGQTVRLAPGSVADFPLQTRSATHFVDGFVLDRENEPVADAFLVASDDGGFYSFTRSAPDGSYSLPAGMGTWRALLESVAGRPDLLPSERSGIEFTADGPQVANSFFLALDPLTTVPVTVTDPTGAPLAGFEVELYSTEGENGAFAGSAVTNADGTALVPVVEGSWQPFVYGAAVRGWRQPEDLIVVANDLPQPPRSYQLEPLPGGQLTPVADGPDGLRWRLEEGAPETLYILHATTDGATWEPLDLLVTTDASGTAEFALPDAFDEADGVLLRAERVP